MAANQCYYCVQPLTNPNARFCPNCRHPLILRDRYRLQRLVGQGGFGVVYEAFDTQVANRRCAIKQVSAYSISSQRQIEVEIGFVSQRAGDFDFVPTIYDVWSDSVANLHCDAVYRRQYA